MIFVYAQESESKRVMDVGCCTFLPYFPSKRTNDRLSNGVRLMHGYVSSSIDVLVMRKTEAPKTRTQLLRKYLSIWLDQKWKPFLLLICQPFVLCFFSASIFSSFLSSILFRSYWMHTIVYPFVNCKRIRLSFRASVLMSIIIILLDEDDNRKKMTTKKWAKISHKLCDRTRLCTMTKRALLRHGLFFLMLLNAEKNCPKEVDEKKRTYFCLSL